MSQLANDQDFDAFFLKRGGLYNPSEHELYYSANYNLYINFIRVTVNKVLDQNLLDYGSRPDVLVNYINNEGANATAAPFNNSYFIAINSGVPYLFERLFNAILANPKNFKLVGLSQEETGSDFRFDTKYKNVCNFIINDELSPFDKPKDDKRKSLAEFLTALAILFLAMHELSHILNGHVNYLESKFGICMLHEELSQEEIADRLLSQTLEFDADAIGICKVINFAIFFWENPGVLPLKFQQFVKDKSEIIGLCTYAIYCVLRVFGNTKASSKPLIQEYYPPFTPRRKFLGGTIVSLLIYKASKGSLLVSDRDNITSKVTEYLFEAELAFRKEKNFNFSNASNKKSLAYALYHASMPTKLEVRHINIIKGNWNLVRPDIAPFAHSELSPIDTKMIPYVPIKI